jgi:threonine/homoserine/homoserine lactone efflux protein
MPEGMLAFAALSAVVAVTPGPDSLLVVQRTLRRGRRDGVRVAAGAGAGSLAWGIGSALGLTGILATSAQLYRGVQLAGAGYLVFLGIQGWRATQRPDPARPSAPHPTPGEGFRAGLLSDVLNPKVGLFFLAVMPQFLPQQAPVTLYALTYAAIDSLVAVAWLAAVAWISGNLRSWVRRPGVQLALDRAAGTVLLGLGLKVAAERNLAT